MYFAPDMPHRNWYWKAGFGCAVLLFACKMPGNAQQRCQILFQNRPIGHIEATRQETQSDRFLSIRSSVQVKLVLNYQLNTRIETEYCSGSLLNAVSWKRSNHSLPIRLSLPGNYLAGMKSVQMPDAAVCALRTLHFVWPICILPNLQRSGKSIPKPKERFFRLRQVNRMCTVWKFRTGFRTSTTTNTDGCFRW